MRVQSPTVVFGLNSNWSILSRDDSIPKNDEEFLISEDGLRKMREIP